MIGAFVQRNIATLTEPELDELEAVMEHWDVDLADWLSGRRPVPDEVASPMLARLIAECNAPGAGLPEHLRPAADGTDNSPADSDLQAKRPSGHRTDA